MGVSTFNVTIDWGAVRDIIELRPWAIWPDPSH
jgi:hypothetical protein